MKDIYLDNQGKIGESYGLAPSPKEFASTVEEVADLITLGQAAIVTANFPTHEVIEFFQDKPTNQNSQ